MLGALDLQGKALLKILTRRLCKRQASPPVIADMATNMPARFQVRNTRVCLGFRAWGLGFWRDLGNSIQPWVVRDVDIRVNMEHVHSLHPEL